MKRPTDRQILFIAIFGLLLVAFCFHYQTIQKKETQIEVLANKAWPTPYPDEMGSMNITAEGCEEHRYYDGVVSEWSVELWDEDTETWVEDYELVRYISFVVKNSVASHNCSQYDPSYDEDYWFWAQHAYNFIDILERRLYNEKYSIKQGE